MDGVHGIAHYFLILWFLNDMREALVSAESFWSFQGIGSLAVLIAGICYFLYFFTSQK